METRICGLCHAEKPLEDFHKNKAQLLGRAYWCKDCANKTDRDRDRARDKTPERIAKSKGWLQSERGRELCAQRRKDDYRRNKQKYNARRTLNRLVKAGVIQKLPCAECGEINSQGHHADYSKATDVVWFCRKHHAIVHRK